VKFCLFNKILILTAAIFMAAFYCFGQPYTISTIAGQGLALGDADWQPTLNSEPFRPWRWDSGNHRVRLVTATTVAGDAGTPASLASQPAKPATLSGPTGVAADLYGNIYFSELTTDVVRMIDTHGNLTVLIGTGPGGQPIARRRCAALRGHESSQRGRG
jgi:hypothetical protein